MAKIFSFNALQKVKRKIRIGCYIKSIRKPRNKRMSSIHSLLTWHTHTHTATQFCLFSFSPTITFQYIIKHFFGLFSFPKQNPKNEYSSYLIRFGCVGWNGCQHSFSFFFFLCHRCCVFVALSKILRKLYHLAKFYTHTMTMAIMGASVFFSLAKLTMKLTKHFLTSKRVHKHTHFEMITNFCTNSS